MFEAGAENYGCGEGAMLAGRKKLKTERYKLENFIFYIPLTGLPPHQEFLILNWRFVLKFYPLPQGEELRMNDTNYKASSTILLINFGFYSVD